MPLHPPLLTPIPYTTLFRSRAGAGALVTRRRPIEAALKATDFIGLDLLPADFSYRNLDLELDDTKKPTRRPERVLRSVAEDRKSTRLHSSHGYTSSAVFCLT